MLAGEVKPFDVLRNGKTVRRVVYHPAVANRSGNGSPATIRILAGDHSTRADILDRPIEIWENESEYTFEADHPVMVWRSVSLGEIFKDIAAIEMALR